MYTTKRLVMINDKINHKFFSKLSCSLQTVKSSSNYLLIFTPEKIILIKKLKK